MPYIIKEKRKEIAPHIFPLLDYIDNTEKLTSGDLNFILTLIIRNYFWRKESYQTANDIVGALEGAKEEFQRRILSEYENKKIQLNGDVYLK